MPTFITYDFFFYFFFSYIPVFIIRKHFQLSFNIQFYLFNNSFFRNGRFDITTKNFLSQLSQVP